MLDSIQKKYDERVKNYRTTINLGKPEEIIIENCCLTGQLGFAGIKVLDCYADPEAYDRSYDKFNSCITGFGSVCIQRFTGNRASYTLVFNSAYVRNRCRPKHFPDIPGSAGMCG